MGENFILKWNDHSASILSAAAVLFSSSGLTDVCIGTADRTFKAHRLVLSICSSSFAALFASNGVLANQTNPYIYMQDIPSNHVELLLRYMYNGEVSVEETDLVSLLSSAKSLGIKGLCEVDNASRETKVKTPVKKKMKKSSGAENRAQATPPLTVLNEFEDEIIEVEPKLQAENMLEPYDDIAEEEDEEGEDGQLMPEDWYGSDNPLDDMGDDHALSEKGLNCPFCPKIFASNWHLKRHVLTHTKENRFRCDVCHKDFSRNDNLKSHMKTIHGVVCPPKPKSTQS